MNGKTCALLLFLSATISAGCYGPNAFTRVDLGGNLPPEAIQRYESEWNALPGAPAMAMIEHSNWWPLGLVAYHRDGMVMRQAGAQGPVYTVMSGHGFGPLCVLYARSTHATFDATGRRVSWMRMHNLLFGHLAMAHESDAMLDDGRREQSLSAHLVHHLLAYHRTDGHSYWAFFTVPNPLGVNLHSHPAP